MVFNILINTAKEPFSQIQIKTPNHQNNNIKNKNQLRKDDVVREREEQEEDTAELMVSCLKFQTFMELESQFWFITDPRFKLGRDKNSGTSLVET